MVKNKLEAVLMMNLEDGDVLEINYTFDEYNIECIECKIFVGDECVEEVTLWEDRETFYQKVLGYKKEVPLGSIEKIWLYEDVVSFQIDGQLVNFEKEEDRVKG